jgi:hypothetical protein
MIKQAIIITTLLTLTLLQCGCERNDYQHPGYRSGKYK